MFAPDDPRYLRGIDLFNRQAYFGAHDVWEDLWHELEGPDRQFVKGLIQVAVCLYHFGRGNLRGATKLFGSSTRYLRPFAPRHAGLDVARLLDDLAWCCSELGGPHGQIGQIGPIGRVKLRPDRLPCIAHQHD